MNHDAEAELSPAQARLAARDPSLVRVLKTGFAFMLDTWVAMHADLRASPRCATVRAICTA